MAGRTRPFSYQLQINYAVLTPKNKFLGLGSFPFARRYLGNRCFFLFLRLLRCFSSAGSLRIPMDSVYDDWGLLSRVSPFRNRRVTGYLLLTAAYRSLSRLSSALSAKASTLRPFLLNLPLYRSVCISWCEYNVVQKTAVTFVTFSLQILDSSNLSFFRYLMSC